MKKSLLIISSIILAFSCSTEIIYVDPTEFIFIQVKEPTTPDQLTSKEIVEQTVAIKGFNKSYIAMAGDNIWTYNISDTQRIPADSKFKLSGHMVIDYAGNLNALYLESSNIILVRENPEIPNKMDTIAYVPNSNMNQARQAVSQAFRSQRYSDCYTIFEDFFIFTPITGEEYRRIQKSN